MEIIDRFKKIWARKWGRRAISLLAIVLLLSMPVRCDSHKGCVIDNLTGEPMADVVVVGYWTYKVPTPAGGVTRCLDATETLTDDQGLFKLKGRWSHLGTAFIGEMSIAIYKVGYRKVQCDWDVITMAGSCYANKPVVIDKGRAVFPMKKVSKGRLMEDGDPPFITCGRKDGKPLSEYHKARREYRRARGLKP